MNESKMHVRSDKSQMWITKEDDFHRIGAPAVINGNGSKEWWHDGLLHREDGPAVIFKDGTLNWFFRGMLHRLDGPAVIHPDGSVEYWVKDRKV